MKAFFLSLIFLFCTWSIFFIGKGIDNIDIMSERYKRALDAGANAASGYRTYDAGEMLSLHGYGYGTGMEDSSNVAIDRQDALRWFYRLFFRNLGIYDADNQEELKKYIPLKAIICYDRLMVADARDNWYTYDPEGEKEYILSYNGKDFKFTLSDQIYDIEGGLWIDCKAIGLEAEDRKAMLNQYIAEELNSFLNSRADVESGYNYKISFSLDDALDDKLSGVNGVNFLVFCEGMPIPSLNPFRHERFYAYSVGGSEIRRINAKQLH